MRGLKKSMTLAFPRCVNLDAQEVRDVLFFSRHTHSFLPPRAGIAYTLRVPTRLAARGPGEGGSGWEGQAAAAGSGLTPEPVSKAFVSDLLVRQSSPAQARIFPITFQEGQSSPAWALLLLLLS